MENLTDDFYEFIGVKQDATNKEIKDACNKLLFKYHPDRCNEVWADGITKRINEIKRVLLDTEKRKAYDKTLPVKKDKVLERIRVSPVRKAKEDEEKEKKEREEAHKKRRNNRAKQPTSKSFCEFCGEDEQITFKCRWCGGRYCTVHRMHDEHDCSNQPSSSPEAKQTKSKSNEASRQNISSWIYTLRDIEKRIESGEGILDMYICPRCKNVRDIDRFICPHCRNERNIKCDWCGKHFCKECIEPYRHDCLEYSREKFKKASKEQYGKMNVEKEVIKVETSPPLWRKISSIFGFGK